MGPGAAHPSFRWHQGGIYWGNTLWMEIRAAGCVRRRGFDVGTRNPLPVKEGSEGKRGRSLLPSTNQLFNGINGYLETRPLRPMASVANLCATMWSSAVPGEGEREAQGAHQKGHLAAGDEKDVTLGHGEHSTLVWRMAVCNHGQPWSSFNRPVAFLLMGNAGPKLST